jgi:4-aminobutyrate aminotransferase / (S)-3-amino-2-methylpropionate transaminase
MYYRRKERGEEGEFTAEELSSCMRNEQPGNPSLQS